MPATDPWLPVGPDLKTVNAAYENPLHALSAAEIPAILLPRSYDPAHCDGLIRRFIDRGLMRDPSDTESQDTRTRIDIGTSLGNLGNDQEGFLDHAVKTHDLFGELFNGFDNPVDVIYDSLSALASGKQVVTAREPDGRLYGPAIFRIHYGGHTYKPHIDHVTLREKRFDYDVTRFGHQFAVLGPERRGKAARQIAAAFALEFGNPIPVAGLGQIQHVARHAQHPGQVLAGPRGNWRVEFQACAYPRCSAGIASQPLFTSRSRPATSSRAC